MQMPHCRRGVFQETAAAAGAGRRRRPAPSMVVDSSGLPTSAPSTRHEQTRRPSSRTLQAPQSPEEQPFLAAGQTELVAQHIEESILRVAEELLLVAIDRGGNVIFGHQSSLAR